MNIITTINIRSDLLKKILQKKETGNVSLNKIVSKLLRKALSWPKNKLKTFIRIKYQDKIEDDELYYHKLHISLYEELYEKCLDMRKLYKLSVSFILAKCIEFYLHKLSTTEIENTDNYHSNYLIFTKEEDGIYSFTVLWEISEKINKHKQFL